MSDRRLADALYHAMGHVFPAVSTPKTPDALGGRDGGNRGKADERALQVPSEKLSECLLQLHIQQCFKCTPFLSCSIRCCCYLERKTVNVSEMERLGAGTKSSEQTRNTKTGTQRTVRCDKNGQLGDCGRRTEMTYGGEGIPVPLWESWPPNQGIKHFN